SPSLSGGRSSAGQARSRRAASAPISLVVAQHDQRGFVVAASLKLSKTFRCNKAGLRRFLYDHQRTRRQPSTRRRRGQCRLRQLLPVRRIEKSEHERLERMRASKLARVAPKDTGRAAQTERGDIGANERARLGRLIDEQRKGGTARERLDAERAGAGKQIEHAGAGDGIAVGVEENVEQRLAQPVGGRPDRLRLP